MPGARIYFGIVCGCFGVFDLSYCRPSCSGRRIGGRYTGVVFSMSVLCLLKHLTSLLPKSSAILVQRPPFFVLEQMM